MLFKWICGDYSGDGWDNWKKTVSCAAVKKEQKSRMWGTAKRVLQVIQRVGGEHKIRVSEVGVSNT